MIKVIISKQHALKESQIALLDALAEEQDCQWSRLDVAASGWTAQKQYDTAVLLSESAAEIVVFASPLPYMLKLMAASAAANKSATTVLVFHNDKREKKELPGGKIIYTVAEEGWELL